jgi:hypothetical protein
MGFLRCDGDSPPDPGVLPPPKTLESGSIRAALPRTGELSAGEANDEIARNAGAGVVPAAEIPFQLSAISMDDDAYAKWRTTWASMATSVVTMVIVLVGSTGLP